MQCTQVSNTYFIQKKYNKNVLAKVILTNTRSKITNKSSFRLTNVTRKPVKALTQKPFRFKAVSEDFKTSNS